MKKVFLLSGILLFILGSVLVLGSYFIFNKYSLSDSRDFGALDFGPLDLGSWSFPNSPLELSEGDIVTVQISTNTEEDLWFRIENSEGTVVLAKFGQNFTVYYYVKTHDLYFMYTQLRMGTAAPNHVSYFLEVTGKAPNQLFLLIGIIVLLAGAVTIPIAFLYKNKSR